MRVRFLALSIILTTLGIAVQAQGGGLPAPQIDLTRGAHSTGVPYGVPGGIETRGSIFFITTFEDENDGTCDQAGTGLSLREALQLCPMLDSNATVYVPAGEYFIGDDLDSDFGNVVIIGEDPLTTIIENTYELRNAGRVFSFILDNTSATVANLTLRGSNAVAASTNKNGGGILIRGRGNVTLNNVIFDQNHAIAGGGLAAQPCGVECVVGAGPFLVTASHLTFTGNTTTSHGGGIYFEGSGTSTLLVENSVFLGNVAGVPGTSAGSGGGLLANLPNAVIVRNSLFMDNTANGIGGGAYLFAYNIQIEDSNFLANQANGYDDLVDPRIDISAFGGGAYIGGLLVNVTGTQFSGNTAGVPLFAGFGGGAYFGGSSATLTNTLIEDNTADNGPDCYGENTVQSLGGNGITDTFDCQFLATETDQFDNILVNGGFEQAGDSENVPAGWTTKNVTGDKRKCNTPEKGFTPFGRCAFVFKGGAGENAQLSQDFGDIIFPSGPDYVLYAVADSAAATTAKIILKAVYTDTALGKDKAKLTYSGDSDSYQAQMAVLEPAGSFKPKVKIKHTGTGGKFYTDRVYLFIPADSLPPRDIRGVLPPPAAPDGFRGGN